ncbi:MAG: fibronectin type III domain-containing protein [Candidatus Kerfeldbacteria bacterium]|nr:fibronectin type III domain-containing protein [Candidatus Kerfeldbacteria bacterium]
MLRVTGGLLAIVITGLWCNSAQALISQPVVEAEGLGPKRASIIWDVPSEATGDKAIVSWQLQLADNLSFSDATTLTYAAATITTELTRDNGLHSIDLFYVRVKGLYADGDTSNYGSTTFYTRPGKLTGLKVKEKAATTVSVKWTKPVREADQLHYDIKLYRIKSGGKKKLVAEDDVYGINNAQFTGLAPNKTRYAFKVRARHDSKYGTGKWSDVKYFRTATN